MTTAKSNDLTLSYEGSVKRVWQSAAKPGQLWFEFTDDYSVFDWGKMPDQIANKGRALALIGAYCFEELSQPAFWQSLPESKHWQKFDRKSLQDRWDNKVFAGENGLSKKGLHTHFLGLTDENCQPLTLPEAIDHSGKLLMQVQGANVYRPQPERILHHNLFFYPQPDGDEEVRLIPLEIVFRFGMPAGSSLADRLSGIPDYLRSLGFSSPPKANQWFPYPILEFFTKLEPKDRFLSWQEAAVMSGLSAEGFAEMTEIALDTALALHEIFARQGLELWDGKVEMVESVATKPLVSRILLADSIGPDELRVMHKGKQLSKEMIRQFYRGSNWERSLQEAQRLAKERATLDWKQICIDELKSNPDQLAADFKTQVDRLYGVLANTLMGRQLFSDHPDIEQYSAALDAIMGAKAK